LRSVTRAAPARNGMGWTAAVCSAPKRPLLEPTLASNRVPLYFAERLLFRDRCVATWYADGQKGAAFHSPPVTVSVGDILTGVITLTDQSAIGFNYSGFFQDIANSGFDLVNVPELLQAVRSATESPNVPIIPIPTRPRCQTSISKQARRPRM
jgi:hypothetical protein